MDCSILIRLLPLLSLQLEKLQDQILLHIQAYFQILENFLLKLKNLKLEDTSLEDFSFNVKGGRCETCQGMGLVKSRNAFLADMFITCDECDGKRFNRETLEIFFNKKNIYDVLEMSVEEAHVFLTIILESRED